MFTSPRLNRTSPRPLLPSSLLRVGVMTAFERGELLVGPQLQGLQLQMSINNPIMGFRFKCEAICSKKVAITAVWVCPLLSALCNAQCRHNASLFSEGESFSLSPCLFIHSNISMRVETGWRKPSWRRAPTWSLSNTLSAFTLNLQMPWSRNIYAPKPLKVRSSWVQVYTKTCLGRGNILGEIGSKRRRRKTKPLPQPSLLVSKHTYNRTL